jgi:hypothetical protein
VESSARDNHGKNEVNQAYHAKAKALDPPDPKTTYLIIADSDPSAHYCTPELPVVNKRRCSDVQVYAANRAVMHATHKAELDIPALPLSARRAILTSGILKCPNHTLSQSEEFVIEIKAKNVWAFLARAFFLLSRVN